MAELIYLDLGQAAYEPTVELQHRLVEGLRQVPQEQAYLLVLEHVPPVITLGRRGLSEHILVPENRLKAEGIEVRKTSRGGDVTYHGPGQLVGYPILRLDLRGRDVRGYLRSLEDAVIWLLNKLDIKGDRVEGMTGVWVGGEKIASIGVAVRRWVTYHGLSLNVSSDLRHFEYIVPCGLYGKKATSISRVLGRPVSVSEVKPLLVESMVRTFGFDGVREASPEGL